MKQIFALTTAAILSLPLIWSCTEEHDTPKVQSISINQEDMTLEEGESVNLTATILPEEATDKTVAWSSSNDEIVMISSNGKAKAMSIGEAMITAKAGDKSDFITITVVAKTIPVTGLSLHPSSITLKVGESQTITSEVTPQNATDKNVTWESSNPEVASVNNGSVTGLNPGSVTITATTVNGGKTADCSVTVKANLAPSVTIGADHISAISAVLSGEANLESTIASDMTMGIMWSLNSGVLPTNSTKIEATEIKAKAYTYASYEYSVVLTGLEPDKTYYYRSYVTQKGQDTYGETKSFTTKVITSMMETKEPSGIDETQATLNAKLDLTDVKYSSIEYGFFWGTSEGSQDSFVKGGDIIEHTYTFELINLPHKTQYWYKAWVKLDGQTFCGDVKTFQTRGVESVSLDKTEYVFNTIGSTLTLKATVLPADSTDKSVEWTSSNADVATVDQNGKVTAINNGIATITVTTNDQRKTASCAITVAQIITSISLDNLDLSIGETCELAPTICPDNAANKNLNWSIDDPSIATINNGLVSAQAKGMATITVSAKDGSGIAATCRIVVSNPCPSGAVYMGTHSSEGYRVYWAKSNLSTNGLCVNSEDFGDYYAWGDTEPNYDSLDPLIWKEGKTGYNLESYKWFDGMYYTKYCTDSNYGPVDNINELQLGENPDETVDDAARAILGGRWRMPTYADCENLMTNCEWEWVYDYNGTGISGRIITASNGKSLFLPSTGYWGDDNNFHPGFARYWSSSLRTETYAPWIIFFDNNGAFLTGWARHLGYPIRPVSD